MGWGSVAGWSEDACAVAARRAFGICNNTLDRCEVPVLCWGWAAAELEARASGHYWSDLQAYHHNTAALL